MSRASWAIQEHHRAVLDREEGAMVREPGGRLTVAAIYPNTYQVGAANLGLAVLYRLINARPDALCERVFLPAGKLAQAYAKTGEPLASLETSRPLAEFDLVLASLSFENDAPNLAAMLAMAGLDAGDGDRPGPLVVAGGVAAMLNPEPYADMVDAFLLGEAEAVLPPFLDAFTAARDAGREELLLELARGVAGFYAPRFYAPHYGPDGLLSQVERLRDGLPLPVTAPKYLGPPAGLARSVITAPGPEFGDMALIEVGRGCGHGCRFCAAGHVFRPPRLGVAEDFRAAALEGAARAGKVGLVSAAVSDLPGAGDLAREICAAGGRVAVSSLRADRLEPELVEALAAGGAQSVALAPEAGSARLRRIINKHLNEDDLFSAVETLITGGMLNLKLYFMVGLPGEEDEDVAALVDLVGRIRQQMVSFGRGQGRLGRLGVSLNAFVPKPWTPFQWEPMAPLKLIQDRMAQVKRGLTGLSNLKVTTDVPKYARLQGALSRGDRRLGPLIAALGRGEKPQPAAKALGLDLDFYAGRVRERDELLPWQVVDHGVSLDYLWQERQRALAGKESPDCRPETCRRCGACGPAETAPLA